ncbi:hypothetical protein P7F60_28425 [Rhizobium sp. YJ-22]|uniref:hypothetical protein n=1 Tax=Rhizobium sp. YJ-22 TaxID=3037556 RepID=UPI0024126A93|nr:hypothetical protein [Rhizobium sp. YJ-22]MDG3580311.1 hypothetical protein [Rhizobium sp. YJ-22]
MKRQLFAAGLMALLPALAPAIVSPCAYAATQSALGDLSRFKAITQDALKLVEKGDLAGAEIRITDFETAWDTAQPTMWPLSHAEWSVVDDAADAAIASLRANKPNAEEARKTLQGLISALDNPSGA